MRFFISIIVMALCATLCSTTFGADDPNSGLRVWALTGAQPELGARQELRVGWEGLLPDIELAIGGLHVDAPEPAVDQWGLRGYAIAHALDAKMLGQAIGHGVTLPDGSLYLGGFGQYSFDRDEEWSGGYVVGGLIGWPKGWETVAEYESLIWNSDDNEYAFLIGLRRKF